MTRNPAKGLLAIFLLMTAHLKTPLAVTNHTSLMVRPDLSGVSRLSFHATAS